MKTTLNNTWNCLKFLVGAPKVEKRWYRRTKSPSIGTMEAYSTSNINTRTRCMRNRDILVRSTWATGIFWYKVHFNRKNRSVMVNQVCKIFLEFCHWCASNLDYIDIDSPPKIFIWCKHCVSFSCDVPCIRKSLFHLYPVPKYPCVPFTFHQLWHSSSRVPPKCYNF